MCDNLTSGLTSNLVNMMRPPNSITIARTDTNGNLSKPLVMFQPLPVGPYGFLEKLWPAYTSMNIPHTNDAVRICMHYNPVLISANHDQAYTRYTLNDDEFKKRHIDIENRHIVIPTEALQMRSMICLMYEGGLYQKANTGSFDVLRWFMLLPSSRTPQLYPVEIQLSPNGTVSASLLTQILHDTGYWSIEFENPEILAKYIATYTEHVVNALQHTRTQNHVNDAKLYTATQIVKPAIVADSLNISTVHIPDKLLDKLRKSLGILPSFLK